MNNVLTAVEIAANYELLIAKLKEVTVGEKQKKVLALYETLEERISLAPASSTVGFHGA